MGLRDFTIYDVILRNQRHASGQLAFVSGQERITHAEFATRVDRLASGLGQAGVLPGDRIAVLADNCLEYVCLYGAVARIGAVLVPINSRAIGDEIHHVLSDTEPRLVVAGDSYQDAIVALRGGLTFVEHFFSLGNGPIALEPFSLLMQGQTLGPPADVSDTSPYVILYTAAVDGRPRGAVLTHRSLIAGSMQLTHYWRMGANDVNLCALPLFHLAGLTLLLATLQAGGMSVVVPRFEAQAAAHTIRRERVTTMGVFPPMLGRVLDCAANSPADLSSLRTLTGLDTPETIARLEKVCPDARFWSGYGQSEVSGYVSLGKFRERPGSAGRAALHSNVAIVDEFDNPVPPGQTGEIVVRGPGVFQGYWNRPTETAETLRGNWHHSGDLGRLDDDGYLWFEGRSPAKELIKPGGENVYPAEVERVIVQHPAIAQAVVIGVPDAEWGEAIKAVCMIRAGHQISEQAVIEFVAARIARHKKPRFVVFVDALPVTSAGIMDRTKVKTDYGTQQ